MQATSPCWALFATLVAFLPAAQADDRLICCGGPEVFVIAATGERSEVKDRVWRWRAEDSPEIPEALRTQFRTTDDCKPCSEDRLLITSSSGGVALIRRKDKHCLFYTSVKNAHSACLLPNGSIVAASSSGGDELLLFSAKESGEKLTPLARLELSGAHGAHWDRQRERLWALGTHELLLVEIAGEKDKPEFKVSDRWKLPSPGGHDLSPARDEQHLYVTSHDAVYRFDKQTKRFDPFEPLAKAVAIKSIDEHPTTGRIVYHQADHANNVWWSDTIRLLEPAATLQVTDERLYKLRWDAGRD